MADKLLTREKIIAAAQGSIEIISMSSREKFEQAIKARFGDLIDYRVCKNSGGEYMAWDMQVAWWAWQAAETDMAVQLANAESKCRELAAECAGMKQLASEAYDEMVSHHDTDCLYSLDADGEQIDALIRLCDAQATIYDTLVMCETPATDAFLAEVRAQGVEMYADTLDRGADDAERDGFEDGMKFLRAEAEGVRKFAAQIRKGAAL